MAEALLDAPSPIATSRHADRNRIRALLAQPKVVFAGGFILFLIILAVFAPLIAPPFSLAAPRSSRICWPARCRQWASPVRSQAFCSVPTILVAMSYRA